jgi:hypothetical protein
LKNLQASALRGALRTLRTMVMAKMPITTPKEMATGIL